MYLLIYNKMCRKESQQMDEDSWRRYMVHWWQLNQDIQHAVSMDIATGHEWTVVVEWYADGEDDWYSFAKGYYKKSGKKLYVIFAPVDKHNTVQSRHLVWQQQILYKTFYCEISGTVCNMGYIWDKTSDHKDECSEK